MIDVKILFRPCVYSVWIFTFINNVVFCVYVTSLISSYYAFVTQCDKDLKSRITNSSTMHICIKSKFQCSNILHSKFQNFGL